MKSVIAFLGCISFGFLLCVSCHDEDLHSTSFYQDSILDYSYDSLSTKQSSLVQLPNGLILEMKDSLYFWDDMVFTEEGLGILISDDIANKSTVNNNRSAFRDQADYYWPYGVVYYKYNSNYTDTIETRNAMNHISNYTSIIFKPKTNSDSNYIEFYHHESANNSLLGMQSGGQIINIHETWRFQAIAHEIMHSLGFFHEHTRSDRDNSILINWSNIKNAMQYNFQKYTSRGYSGMDLGTLDFQSIMIYDSYISDPSFVNDPTIPVMTKIDGVSTFTQGDSLSLGDIAGVSSIYGPPFHRLETHILDIVEDSYSGFADRYIVERSDSLVFYADRSCTIRQPLISPRRIKVVVSYETNQGSGLVQDGLTYTLTIPAGTSSYCLWNGYNYYIYYMSDPAIGYSVTEHDIVNKHVSSVFYPPY